MKSAQELPQSHEEFYPRWRTLLHFIVGLVFMLAFWLLGLFYVFVCRIVSILRRDSPEQHRSTGQRTLSRAFRFCIKGLTIIGIIEIDDHELAERMPMQGPLIIASNHPALWDALLISQHCDQVSCIMKASLLSNPLLRGGSLFAGFLPNSPQIDMIKCATERLKSGGQLLLFPEGTRTQEENWPINPFHPGMALIACKSKAPMLPVFISTNSPYLQKGWPILKMPDLPIRLTLRVGDILLASPDEGAREFSERMESVFREQLQSS